jgi:hypothetical protein
MEEVLFDKADFIRPANQVFNLKSLPDTLYITIDALHASHPNANESWVLQGLKEVHHLLVVQDGDKPPQYITVSQETARRYLLQMKANQIKGNRKAALIGKDGILIENGKFEHGFSSDYLLGLTTDSAFRELSAWCGLMCGQVGQSEVIKTLFQNHEDEVVKLFLAVREKQVNPSNREFKRFEILRAEKKRPEASNETAFVYKPSLESLIREEKSKRSDHEKVILEEQKFQFSKASEWKVLKVKGQSLNPVLQLSKKKSSAPEKKEKEKLPEPSQLVDEAKQEEIHPVSSNDAQTDNRIPSTGIKNLPEADPVPKEEPEQPSPVAHNLPPKGFKSSRLEKLLSIGWKICLIVGTAFACLSIVSNSVRLSHLKNKLTIAAGGAFLFSVICGMIVRRRNHHKGHRE